MKLFDIIGPIMVGPSSSHTAGAVKIGYVAGKLLGEPVKEAKIYMYGSFLATGKGHGTEKAIVAGLLGMLTDDVRIPDSFMWAEKLGMKFSIGEVDLKEAHPNSVKLVLKGESGKELELIGESVGGSRINIAEIDGIATRVSGDYPTLIIHNMDKPGCLSDVTYVLAKREINVANMQLYRSGRAADAVMVIECDEQIDTDVVKMLEKVNGVIGVTYLCL